MPKYSIIVGFLGETKDRFHTYNRAINLDEKLAILRDIPGYTGAEIVYPYEARDPDELKGLLKRHDVELSMINVNVKGEPEFFAGGITSPRKEVRQKAISLYSREWRGHRHLLHL